MNRKRRDKILVAVNEINIIKDDIDNLKCEEEESLSNMPESLEQTTNYENSEKAVDSLEEAAGYLDDVVQALSDAL